METGLLIARGLPAFLFAIVLITWSGCASAEPAEFMDGASDGSDGLWDSHKLFLGIAACGRTCECWSNIGIPEDMRQARNRRAFPKLSHRINVLIPIAYSYVS